MQQAGEELPSRYELKIKTKNAAQSAGLITLQPS